MNLRRETIQEFQKVLSDEFGIDINEVEANEAIGQLVEYFTLLGKLKYQYESDKSSISKNKQ